MIRLRLVFNNDRYEFISRCTVQLYRAGMFSSLERVEPFILPLIRQCYSFEVVE